MLRLVREVQIYSMASLLEPANVTPDATVLIKTYLQQMYDTEVDCLSRVLK